MTIKRLWNIFRISLMKNGFQRAEYLKRKRIFAEQGKNCFWQPRNIPPEAKLIKLHDNVVIASEVLFINHDVIHYVLNNMDNSHKYSLNLGAIEIGNNVFIGSRSIILPNTFIGDNVIIGAGSIVRGHIQSGGVYAGSPAKCIGNFFNVTTKRKNININIKPKAKRFDDIWTLFDMNYKGVNI